MGTRSNCPGLGPELTHSRGLPGQFLPFGSICGWDTVRIVNILRATALRSDRIKTKRAVSKAAGTGGVSGDQLVSLMLSEPRCAMPYVTWCWQLPSRAQRPACVEPDPWGITTAHWRWRRPGQSASAGQSSPITFSSTQTVAWGTTTTAGTRMGELHPGASTGSRRGPSAGPTATVTKVRAAARPLPAPQLRCRWVSDQKPVLNRPASSGWDTLWKKHVQ